MDIKTINITANRLIGSDSAQLMTDCEAVADTKPAIEKVLKADGRIIIDSREVMEDRISYKGRFLCDVLYISKGDKGLYGISAEAPINDFVEIKGAEPGMSSSLECNVSNIDFSLINDRKVNVRAMADVKGEVSERTDIEAITEIEDLPRAQQRFANIKTVSTVLEKRDRFNVNEDITVPAAKLPVEEVLSLETNIVNTELMPLQDSVNARGDISAAVLYTSKESRLPEVYEFDIPFDGNIEAEGADAGMDIRGSFFVENVYYDIDENENGENRVINIEITVGVEFEITNSSENMVLEDAYSVNNEIKTENVQICVNNEICRNKSQYPVKEVISLSEEAPDMLQIFKAGGTPYIDDVKIYDNRVVIDGGINADIMYVTGDDAMPVYNYRGVIPFSQTVEARGAKEGMRADLSSGIAHIGFNMLSDREVEVRCALNTNTVVRNMVCYTVPVSAEILPIDEELLNRLPGMVIYVVKKGDTLWKLAKRFNSTVENIAEINNIEDPDLIYPGQRFVILKKIG